MQCRDARETINGQYDVPRHPSITPEKLRVAYKHLDECELCRAWDRREDRRVVADAHSAMRRFFGEHPDLLDP